MELRTINKYTLEPRTKFLLILLANILLFTYGPNIYIHLTMIYGLLLMIIFKKVKEAYKFGLFYFSIHILTYFISFAPKEIYSIWEILILPLVIFMPILIFSYIFFATTEVSEIITSLQKMNTPSFIITPIIVIFRFFPTLKIELNAIKDAMKLKGIKKNPIKVLEYVYVPLLFSSVKISEDLNASGLARGLGLYNKSTQTVSTRFTFLDLLSVLILICFIVLRKGVLNI